MRHCATSFLKSDFDAMTSTKVKFVNPLFSQRSYNCSAYRGLIIRIFFLLCFISLFLSPAFCQDSEREEKILYYASQIDIDTSGVVHVTETIRVRSLAQDIRHGIYRSIPTIYKGPFFETVTIPLDVTSVLRDGTPEPYDLQRADNGVRIVIGDANAELPAGDYTYTIAYTVDHQIGFFGDYDELYWNVTGSGWKFKIDSVYVVVNLPAGGTVLKERLSAYSGASGETGCDCKIVPISESSVAFHTTQPLYAYEGLTIAAPFEKGLITPPTDDERMERLIADNYPAMIALTGLCIVLSYYIIAWLFVGKDPKGRSIIPRFEPPQNLAPYELRYISKMKFDNQVMVSSLVWMAQNEYLTIQETDKSIYTLTREKVSGQPPRAIEKSLLNTLFAGKQSVTLDRKYNPAVTRAMADLEEHLKKNFKNTAFRLNRPWLVIGIILSLATIIFSAFQHPADASIPGLFILVWTSSWTFACYFLVKNVVQAFQRRKYGHGIGGLLFAIPFLVGEVFGVIFLAGFFSFYTFVSTLLLALINVVFYHLLKAPTLHGRQLLDEIEGFARFLRTAEINRMQSLTTGPEMDLRLFQQYLPFALALDLQTEWARHFENQLNAPNQQKQIAWYTEMSPSRSLGAFSSSLSNSFSSTISSSSTPPSSSSGSSGGGSSGGGGVGGGGGGW